MRIGLLETGIVPTDMIGRHGDYISMFARLLEPVEDGLVLRSYRVVDGVLPDATKEQQGWLITGSPHGVYEDLGWMRSLKDFLRRSCEDAVPVVGICFGHQILAEAMGGKVEKSSRGWGCGIHRYDLKGSHPGRPGLAASFTLQAMHQDQVVRPPPGADVLAGSDFCPYGALAYGRSALSFQGHPEFTADFARELIETRRERVIPGGTADAALGDIDRETDAAGIAAWIGDMFRQTAGAAPGTARISAPVQP